MDKNKQPASKGWQRTQSAQSMEELPLHTWRFFTSNFRCRHNGSQWWCDHWNLLEAGCLFLSEDSSLAFPFRFSCRLKAFTSTCMILLISSKLASDCCLDIDLSEEREMVLCLSEVVGSSESVVSSTN